MATGTIGILLTAASIAAIANGYPTYQHLVSLIPQNELPKNADEAMKRTATLVAHYPNDPRAHLFMAKVKADDPAAAERELRIALAQAEELRVMLGPRLADETRRRLAEALLATAAAKRRSRRYAASASRHPERLRTRNYARR